MVRDIKDTTIKAKMTICHPSKPESEIMEIKILRTGCTRCNLLKENVRTSNQYLKINRIFIDIYPDL